MMKGTGQSSSKSANNSSPMRRGRRGIYGDIHLNGYIREQKASAVAVRFSEEEEMNKTFSSRRS